MINHVITSIYLFLSFALVSCVGKSLKKTSKAVDNESIEEVITDIRDGIGYKAEKIGRTYWMMENLKYADKRQMIIDTSNTMGHYYLRKKSNEVCPDGWRLPKISELNELISSLDGVPLPERGGKKVSSKEIDLLNIQMGGFALTKEDTIKFRAVNYMSILLTASDSAITTITKEGKEETVLYSVGLHVYPTDKKRDSFNIEPTFDKDNTAYFNCRCVKN